MMRNKSLMIIIARSNNKDAETLEAALLRFVLPCEARDMDMSIVRYYELKDKLPEKYSTFIDIACSAYIG